VILTVLLVCVVGTFPLSWDDWQTKGRVMFALQNNLAC